jgi:hypothetical protein
MPSADSRIHVRLPLRFAHSLLCLPSRPSVCVPPPFQGSARLWSGHDIPSTPGDFVNRLSLCPVFQTTSPPRCSGPPGVNSGYFQRTIVRYTKFDHMTDRGLYPVLRTRPGLTSPRICLPSTFWVRGIPVRQPALLPPASFSPYFAVKTLPAAILRLRQAGYGLCSIPVS